MSAVREFEVGKSAYYVRDGATVCRGKILSKGLGSTVGGASSYRLRGSSEEVMEDKLFATAEEAKATIVPRRWWRGNNEHSE